MTSAKQRFQQGIRALLAFSIPLDTQLAQAHLNSAQMDAFNQMSRAEQLHSLNVLREVLAQEQATPHPLAVAALLHDVGKSRYHLWVWQKTIAVLIKAFSPPLSDYLTRDETLNFWSAPFVVRVYHPKWSADILRACKSDETSIWLVEYHQESAEIFHDHPHYNLLQRLQSADDAN